MNGRNIVRNYFLRILYLVFYFLMLLLRRMHRQVITYDYVIEKLTLLQAENLRHDNNAEFFLELR